jgi:hypothetical protein
MRSQRIGLRLYAIARRADLLGLERLLDLLQVREQAHVVGELVADAATPAGVDDLRVDLARVRLPGDGVHRSNPIFAPPGGRAAHLRVVAVEQVQEARLRPGRPLHPAERSVAIRRLDLLQVEQQVLDPERRALADGRELRRLEVRVAERGQVACSRANAPARRSPPASGARPAAAPRACWIRSALSPTYCARRAQVDDARAAGAGSPNVWTCAITSCRSRFSARRRASGRCRRGARGIGHWSLVIGHWSGYQPRRGGRW